MYNPSMIERCIFIKRLNRFVATVELESTGEVIDVHVKNTGRCKELLIEGSIGFLERSENKKRKYEYDLISIYKGDLLVNFDSQIPNEVVHDFLMKETIFTNIQTIKREVTYGKSRFDIYIERLNEEGKLEKFFVEVKGVTLFDGLNASFPDAPTTRGVKHIEELVNCQKDGYKAYIFFLAQAEGIESFKPNEEIDPKFASSLKFAKENGVNILCYNSMVTESYIEVNNKVKVLI